jgi:tetratricopeptide (TPR) repeat protein
MALQKQGKLAQAAQAWLAITQRNPNDAAAFASLGYVLSCEQKYPEAAAAYQKAIRLNPTLPGVELNLGLAEFKQGHFEGAIPPLRAALAADPHSMQATTLLGLSHYAARHFEEAVKYLELAAASDQSNKELLQTLAQSCLLAKKYSCALEEFGKLEQLDPDSSAVHLFTAEALDGEGKTEEAIKEVQTSLKLSPREPNLNFVLGHLYWEAERYDDAIAAFEAELLIVPENAKAIAYLGDIAMKQGDNQKALTLLRKAAQLQDNIRLAYMDIGGILVDQKHYPEALSALQQAVKLDPAQPDAHFRLGHVYQLMGNSAAAEKEFAKVRELKEKQDRDIASKLGKNPTN